VALAQGAIARHRDIVVGVKARLSENVAGANGCTGRRGNAGGAGRHVRIPG
jgi:predicted amidohydrolase